MSPQRVTPVTVIPVLASDNNCEAHFMPILMLALIALAAFGLIGFLLAAAVICESKAANRNRDVPRQGSVGKSAA